MSRLLKPRKDADHDLKSFFGGRLRIDAANPTDILQTNLAAEVIGFAETEAEAKAGL